MFGRYYSLVLCVFWLVIGVFLLGPETMIPPNIREHLRGPLGLPAGLLAITLAAYNFTRWWSYRSMLRNQLARQRNPLSVRKLDPDEGNIPDARNPDLDFFRRTAPEGPPEAGPAEPS